MTVEDLTPGELVEFDRLRREGWLLYCYTMFPLDTPEYRRKALFHMRELEQAQTNEICGGTKWVRR